MDTHPVANSFTVDRPQVGETIVDINNPPKRRYNPHAPENQYPKMLYPANYPAGKPVIAKDKDDEERLLKRGMSLKPPATPDEPEVTEHSGGPSAADLDAVAAEQEVVERTAGKRKK